MNVQFKTNIKEKSKKKTSVNKKLSSKEDIPKKSTLSRSNSSTHSIQINLNSNKYDSNNDDDNNSKNEPFNEISSLVRDRKIVMIHKSKPSDNNLLLLSPSSFPNHEQKRTSSFSTLSSSNNSSFIENSNINSNSSKNKSVLASSSSLQSIKLKLKSKNGQSMASSSDSNKANNNKYPSSNNNSNNNHIKASRQFQELKHSSSIPKKTRILSIWQRCFKTDMISFIDRQLDILTEIQSHLANMQSPLGEDVIMEFSEFIIVHDTYSLYRVFQDESWSSIVKEEVVKVIAILTHEMSTGREEFFDAILSIALERCSSKDYKDQVLIDWLLQTINASVKYDYVLSSAKHFDDRVYTLIVRSYEKIMDKMCDSSYLFKIMETIHYIADKAHAPLFNNFQSIIDILIGWNINEDSSDQISQLIIESFEKLWPYWSHQLEFGFNLMTEMLKDMQTHAHIPLNFSEPIDPYELQKIHKIPTELPSILVPLLKCIFSVLNGVSNAIFNSFNDYIQKRPSDKIAEKTLRISRTLFQLIYAIYMKFDNTPWRKSSVFVISRLKSIYVREFTELRPIAAMIMLTEVNNLMLPDAIEIRKDGKQVVKVLQDLEKNLEPFIGVDQGLLIDLLLNPYKSPIINNFKIYFGTNQEIINAYLKVIKTVLAHEPKVDDYGSIMIVMKVFTSEMSLLIPNYDKNTDHGIDDIEDEVQQEDVYEQDVVHYTGGSGYLDELEELADEEIEIEHEEKTQEGTEDMNNNCSSSMVVEEEDELHQDFDQEVEETQKQQPKKSQYKKYTIPVLGILSERYSKKLPILFFNLSCLIRLVKYISEDKKQKIRLQLDLQSFFTRNSLSESSSDDDASMKAASGLLNGSIITSSTARNWVYHEDYEEQTHVYDFYFNLLNTSTHISILFQTLGWLKLTATSLVGKYQNKDDVPTSLLESFKKIFDLILYQQDIMIVTQCLDIIHTISRNIYLFETIYSDQKELIYVLETALQRGKSTNQVISNILLSLNPFKTSTLRNQMDSNYESLLRILAQNPCSATFKPLYFHLFMVYLGIDSKSNDISNMPISSSWVYQLYKESGYKYILNSILERKGHQKLRLWEHMLISMDWMVLQSIRYLLSNKLKSYLGGPKEFFQAAEKTLSVYSRGVDLNDPSHHVARQRLHLLIRFLDLFETYVTSASECRIEDLLKPVMLFFVTNRRVCSDWFGRTRILMIDCCKVALSADEMLLKYCAKALLEKEVVLKKNASLVNSNFRNEMFYILLEAIKISDVLDDHKSTANISAYVKNFSGTSLDTVKFSAVIFEAFNCLVSGQYDKAQDLIQSRTWENEVKELIGTFYSRSLQFENKLLNKSTESHLASFSYSEDISKLCKWDEAFFNTPPTMAVSSKAVGNLNLDEKSFNLLSAKLYPQVALPQIDNWSTSFHQMISMSDESQSLNLKYSLSVAKKEARFVDRILHLFSYFKPLSKTMKELSQDPEFSYLKATHAMKAGRFKFAWSILHQEDIKYPNSEKLWRLMLKLAKEINCFEDTLDKLSDALQDWKPNVDIPLKSSLKNIFLENVYPANGLDDNKIIQVINKILPSAYRKTNAIDPVTGMQTQTIKSMFEPLLKTSLAEFTQDKDHWCKYADFHFACFNDLIEQPVEAYLKQRIPEKFISLINIYALKKAISEATIAADEKHSTGKFTPDSMQIKIDVDQIWISEPTEDAVTRKEMDYSIKQMIFNASGHLQTAHSAIIKCLTQYGVSSMGMGLKFIHLITSFPQLVEQLKVQAGWINRLPASFLTQHKDRWVSRLAHIHSYVQDFACQMLIQIKEKMPEYVQYDLAYVRVCSRFIPASERRTTVTVPANQISPVTRMLEQLGPELYTLSRIFVELQKSTLLWEDMWIFEIRQKQAAVIKAINVMENEKKSMSFSETSESTRHRLLGPVISSIYSLMIETILQNRVTGKYRKNFITHYKADLTTAYDQLKSATNYLQVKSAWNGFMQVCSKLLEQSKKNRHVKLRDVSPFLALFQGMNSLQIPGKSMSSKKVFLTGFDKMIKLILTKTRPKTVLLKGSDGLNYRFLLKASEDLRLDQRILEVMNFTNTKLQDHGHPDLNCLTFDVVPFGETFGLVQWVDGLSQIFGIFKTFEQRKATLIPPMQQQQQHQQQLQQQKRGGMSFNPDRQSHAPATISSSNRRMSSMKGNSKNGRRQSKLLPLPIPVEEKPLSVWIMNYRPNEIFHQVLFDLLGDTSVAYTKEGSVGQEELNEVFNKLSENHPKDIISNALLLTCSSSRSWIAKTRNFADSLGVMSAVGYVLGLGDRHLDNILLNVTTGQVLHIDFNISFEKGQRLRIPEYVPFRLTKNFQHALGLGGPSGQFKLAMKSAFEVLQEGEQTWISLFEDFFIDPILDYNLLQTTPQRTQSTRLFNNIIKQQLHPERKVFNSTGKRVSMTVPPLGIMEEDESEQAAKEAGQVAKLNVSAIAEESEDQVQPQTVQVNEQQEQQPKEQKDVGSLDRILESQTSVEFSQQSQDSQRLLTDEALGESLELKDDDDDSVDSSKYSSNDSDAPEVANDAEQDNGFRAQHVIRRLKEKMAVDNVDELIDSLIQEATSPINLSRMYPGWMAWI